jgi:methyl-accepting chemotaxis protein
MSNSVENNFWQLLGLYTLRSRFIAVVSLIVFLLFVSALLVWVQNKHTKEIVGRVQKQYFPLTLLTTRLMGDINNTSVNNRAYLMSGDVKAKEARTTAWLKDILPAIDSLNTFRRVLKGDKFVARLDTIVKFVKFLKSAQEYNISYFEQNRHRLDIHTSPADSSNARLLLSKIKDSQEVRKALNQQTTNMVRKVRIELKGLLDELNNSQLKALQKDFSLLSQNLNMTNTTIVLISSFTILFALLTVYLVLLNFRNSLSLPTSLLHKLTKGELTTLTAPTYNEFDKIMEAVSTLSNRLQNASQFATEVGEEKFDTTFEASGEADLLGNSLLQMREKLKEVAVEDSRRTWATEGYAQLSDLIRANNDNIGTLSERFLFALIELLGANQGGVFILEDAEDKKYLRLKASYAYNRKKHLQKQITIHDDYAETLIGQVYLEQEKILLSDLPEGYLEITSGLGDATPTNLLIVPIKTNDLVSGVIELASFQTFYTYQLDFVERICETLASAIINVKVNEKTRNLLKETQKQSEALQQQEEEMRQNFEELQATQEQMRKIQQELLEKEANLSGLINSTDESLIAVDTEYRAIALNDVLLRRYKGTNYEGIQVGVNVLNFLGEAREEWKGIYDRGLAGEKYDFIKKSTVNNEDSYRHYFINPIYNAEKTVLGVSCFSRDITKHKREEETYLLLIEDLRVRNQLLERVHGGMELDEDFCVRQISTNIAKLLRIDREVNGSSIESLLPISQAAIKSAVDTTETGKITIKLPDISPTPISLNVAKWQNPSNQSLNYYLFFDISSLV